MKKIWAVLITFVLLLTGCGQGEINGVSGTVAGKSDGGEAKTQTEPADEGGATEKTEPESDEPEGLSLEDKLWQLFYVTPEAVSGEGEVTSVTEKFAAGAAKYKVGGIILFGKNIQDRMQVMKLLGDISVSFDIPVFLGVDEEGGLVTRLSGACGVTDNGNMSDVETVSQARRIGENLGSQLGGLGFNMDFAPVADVIVDPNNTEIGPRSFGTDPADVSEKVAAEVEGMQGRGVSSVLKHFPGHGSTTTNSHNGTSISGRTLEQLRETELLPFISGIESGADFVMVSHMSLPEVVGDETPCSLSPAIIDGLLRQELGYEGIVITDALNMGAVSEIYDAGEACVMAVEAGADMLLMPAGLEEAHAALLEAVRSGRLTEERIDESVERIFTVKRKMGLVK